MRNYAAAVTVPESIFTSPGETRKSVFSSKLMPDGTFKLTEIDSIDIKAEINSHASTCDMAYILSRLKVGDSSVLQSKPGVYGDFTVFPKTYAEMLQLVSSGEEAFNQLPVDVRSKFGHSFTRWVSTIGTDSWREAMQIPKPTPTVPGVDVVSPSEPVPVLPKE